MERRKLLDTEVYDLDEDEENSVVQGTETVDLSELAKSELAKSGKLQRRKSSKNNKKRSIAGSEKVRNQQRNSKISHESPSMGRLEYIDVTDDVTDRINQTEM